MKISDKIDISIKNYIGQLEDGIVVLISVMYEEKAYEATYWYDKEYRVITLEDELHEIIGEVEEMDEYSDIMKYLHENTSDFDEMYSTLKPV